MDEFEIYSGILSGIISYFIITWLGYGVIGFILTWIISFIILLALFEILPTIIRYFKYQVKGI